MAKQVTFNEQDEVNYDTGAEQMTGVILYTLKSFDGVVLFWIISVPGYNERYYANDPRYAKFDTVGCPNPYYDLVIVSDESDIKLAESHQHRIIDWDGDTAFCDECKQVLGKECPACNGTGKISDGCCGHCIGDGWIE